MASAEKKKKNMLLFSSKDDDHDGFFLSLKALAQKGEVSKVLTILFPMHFPESHVDPDTQKQDPKSGKSQVGRI